MKTNAQALNVKLDVNQLRQVLQQQGLTPDLVEDAVKHIEDKTKQTQQQANPVPTTMNPTPNVMKPMGNRYLDLATRYVGVWAEPGRQLGPNADIPSLAEANSTENEDTTTKPKDIAIDEAKRIGETIGINWADAKFSPEAFAQGMKIEFEHGAKDEQTNVTNDDPEMTGKIAWAHLKEDPDYYSKLQKMEQKNKQEVTAALRRSGMTIKELQENILPQLEDQLFEIDVALQGNMLSEARESLHEAAATLDLVRIKIDSLGDVDPVVFEPTKNEEKGPLNKFLS